MHTVGHTVVAVLADGENATANDQGMCLSQVSCIYSFFPQIVQLGICIVLKLIFLLFLKL